MRGMIVGALCLLLAGCGVQSILNSITTSEDRSYAISIIRALRTGDDAAVMRDMPQTLSARIKPELPKMRESLPQSANADVHLVEARAELLTASRRTRLVYAVDDNRRHALVSLSIVRLKDDVFLQGLYVTGLPQPIESLAPSFSLSGKAWGQYLFLGCALLALCTSLTSLYVLYRATNVPRKWPWAVACAFGVGQITMNWETGQVFARICGR